MLKDNIVICILELPISIVWKENFSLRDNIHFANRISSFQDILYKLNVYGISRAFFHKFYIDYLVNNILKIYLEVSVQPLLVYFYNHGSMGTKQSW